MEDGNKMEIFITLTKYNTHHGEGNSLLVGNYLVTIGTYPLMFIGTVYNSMNSAILAQGMGK